MSLQTTRLAANKGAPLALEVGGFLPHPVVLLWHISRLPGVEVISMHSRPAIDHFDAYFMYKGCLFTMHVPLVKVWVSQVGAAPEELVFAEVERQVQRFSLWLLPFMPFAFHKYRGLPLSPPREVLHSYGAIAQNAL